METIRHAVALDFLRHLGEPAFCEDFNGFGYHMMVFSLADGVDGELALGRASASDRIFGGPFGPVIDKAGLLTGDAFPFAETSAAEDAAFFRVVLLWFWRDLAHFQHQSRCGPRGSHHWRRSTSTRADGHGAACARSHADCRRRRWRVW